MRSSCCVLAILFVLRRHLFDTFVCLWLLRSATPLCREHQDGDFYLLFLSRTIIFGQFLLLIQSFDIHLCNYFSANSCAHFNSLFFFFFNLSCHFSVSLSLLPSVRFCGPRTSTRTCHDRSGRYGRAEKG